MISKISGSFWLYADSFEPSILLDRIPLQPTRTWRKGDQLGKSALKCRFSAWEYGIRKESRHVQEIVSDLLDVVEMYRKEIDEAMAMYHLQSKIYIGVTVFDEPPGVVEFPSILLSTELMSRVLRMNAEIDIDIAEVAL